MAIQSLTKNPKIAKSTIIVFDKRLPLVTISCNLMAPRSIFPSSISIRGPCGVDHAGATRGPCMVDTGSIQGLPMPVYPSKVRHVKQSGTFFRVPWDFLEFLRNSWKSIQGARHWRSPNNFIMYSFINVHTKSLHRPTLRKQTSTHTYKRFQSIDVSHKD